MKVVTYNVNGLRQRISQFGSLSKLLDSFDADIICFQETKLRRQEMTADVGLRLSVGLTQLSQAANQLYLLQQRKASLVFFGTVLRRKVLPLQWQALRTLQKMSFYKSIMRAGASSRIITTLFFSTYMVLELNLMILKGANSSLNFTRCCRWEYLLQQGRRILVVGDLNIAPAAIDRCDANPDFEKNQFRTWLRSMTVQNGGHFFDVFRSLHPERRDAYTCWPSNTGAEQFNFGSRIDHILSAGPCLHENCDSEDHNFIACHVKECDILTQYKRWKPGNTPRWNGGWSTKLEGSDHAPVYVSLMEITDVPLHDSPSSSSRYFPMIRGLQQTLVSVLMKRQRTERVEVSGMSISPSFESSIMKSCDKSSLKWSISKSTGPDHSENSVGEVGHTSSQRMDPDMKRKTKKGKSSQLSLKSFFQESPKCSQKVENPSNWFDEETREPPVGETMNGSQQDELTMPSDSSQKQDEANLTCSSSEKERNSTAVMQWQRIQQLMQNKIPLCKGHNEPCVSRVVKKSGPNFGRRFYSCARAEGPSSNPEANCGFFKWSASKSKPK